MRCISLQHTFTISIIIKSISIIISQVPNPLAAWGWAEVEFVSGGNFSIFTHFLVFLSLKLLKLGEIDSLKILPENLAV